MTSADIDQRVEELFSLFKLPTMAAEGARRFRGAGHDDALESLLETVLETLEAGCGAATGCCGPLVWHQARPGRRSIRSGSPKASLPVCNSSPPVTSWNAPPTSCASACRALRKPTLLAPWAMLSCSAGMPCCSRRRRSRSFD